jgi:long-chain acyl-CoA synthetase
VTAASSVLDAIREHARTNRSHPALQSDRGGATETISYAELVARFDAAAARLRDAGVAPGSRCGLVARQGAGFVEHALAILAAGGCLVPIPDDAAGPARERFADAAQLQHVIAEEDGFACRRWRGALREEAEFRALGPAYLRFTSGTTSARKGVVLSHARIAERLAAANAALAIGPDDRILWLLPMAHHFVVSILLYLRYGATILLPAGSLARPVLEFAARERATLSYASPFHYSLLAKDASEIELDLRLAISTAEGLRADIAASFRARFGHALAQALGIIEVGLPVLNAAAAESKPTALGRPLPAYDVWLRDDDGKPVLGPGSPERTGEICIRGPGLFDAYLSPWTPSAPLLEPDGFRTGDQGYFDADGVLYLAGRRHNRINMAGMKFFSEEVEEVIARVPGVRECRVFAREHEKLGEIPVAEIVPEDPARAPARGDLVAACRAALPAYKIPREFRIVDALARTATGKLQR